MKQTDNDKLVEADQHMHTLEEWKMLGVKFKYKVCRKSRLMFH